MRLLVGYVPARDGSGWQAQLWSSLTNLVWECEHHHHEGSEALDCAMQEQAVRSGGSVLPPEPLPATVATIVRDLLTGAVGICCATCRATSWNPTDVRELYCGRCRCFLADPPPPKSA